MKKHNEGYVLVLVMVIILVLTICATAVLSFSLNNLKTQQRMVERMQDKYAAAGAIEAVKAQLDALEIKDVAGESAEDIIKTKIIEICDNISSEYGIELHPDLDGLAEDETEPDSSYEMTYSLEIAVNCENASATCILSLKTEVQKTQEIENVTTTKYTFSGIETEYTSYKIGGGST